MGKEAAVIGIGDLFRRDAGLGSWAVEFLDQEGLSAHVELVDLGTGIGNLDTYFNRHEYLLLVQAWPKGNSPGRICRLGPEGVVRLLQGKKEGIGLASFCLSPFSLFQDTLAYLRAMYRLGIVRGEVSLMGVEPKDLSPGMGLSLPVQKVLHRFLRLIRRDLEERGYVPLKSSVVVPLRRYCFGGLRNGT
ncbi:hydrogenase maturation protease [Ammonifex degensii KC4]|uniref:Hydrogenase maturation protease n=1 Tax=Ammonifex degensii (strain DSM 10501 / KC4) TaxID=429009 RepID=C9RB25_AMMDK|nr:hydrogenase maturation protease [Ammonifex degensii]ACX51452.1 hydrogenase maturation protease [Ammonifex degensii KC4]